MRLYTIIVALLTPTLQNVAADHRAAVTNLPALPPLFPTLSIPDESGKSVPLLSLDACRAEFRHLKKIIHRTDLKDPAVETDGWTHNIAEAERPFMAFAYLGYSCANPTAVDSELRAGYIDEMRFLIDAMQTERLSGFLLKAQSLKARR